LIVLSALVSYGQEPKALKVLAIGNSYSVDAINQNLHELAAAAGKTIVIGNLYIGGCSLERHYSSLVEHKADYTYYKIGPDGVIQTTKNVEITAGLNDEPWDIITLQQTSRTSGLSEGYEPFLGNLVEYLHKNYPSAILYFHQTWAYMVNSTHNSFPNYDRDQQKMYAGIMERSSELCNKYNLKVIPCGTAIQNLRSSYIGQNANRDGHHLGFITGRFTAALTWYAALFGGNPVENSYAPEGILPFQADAAREAARLAVESPFRCTSMSGFKPKPDPDRMHKIKSSKPDVLASEVYGTCPNRSESKMRYELIREKKGLLGGKANAREVIVYYCKSEDPYSKKYWNSYRLLILIPSNASSPAPVLLGMNSRGNHSITAENWVHKPDKHEIAVYKVYDNQPKGADAEIWQAEKLIDAGYALVTYCYADVCPDFNECRSIGVQRCYKDTYTWGAIAAWAWSLSRTMDYIEMSNDLDKAKVYLFGKGKFSKAAKWAAENDKRLIVTSPGKLPDWYKLQDGDTGPYESHPHWYCDNFYYHSGFPEP